MILPTTFTTDLWLLAEFLETANLVVFDFETDSLLPRSALTAGIGFFFPEPDIAFYINVGHTQTDDRLPRYSVKDVVKALTPFFCNPNKLAIAHNATYDIRMLYKLGVPVRCKIACTLIRSHRCDENLRTFANVHTTHYYTDVRYGLKELTIIYYNEKPATLHDVIGKRNTINASPFDVAKYCIADVCNTWRLYERSEKHLKNDHRLRKLVERIDDTNNTVIAEMMWDGILIDIHEAARQLKIYQQSIQNCRNEIWKRLKNTRPLDSPTHVRAILRSLKLGDELPYDPFYQVQDGDSEPSIRREKLLDIFSHCDNELKKEVIALFVSKWQMEQRISSFLRPLPEFVRFSGGRLYPSRFSSALITTRFSSSPNVQNLPKRGDKTDPDENWRAILPAGCGESHKTANIFIAKPSYMLIQMDYKSAEPRYLGLLFQRALENHDLLFLGAKSKLQTERWGKYPTLMRAKAASANIATRASKNEKKWPTYHDDPLWLVFRENGDPYEALLMAMMPNEYKQAVKNGNERKWLANNRWIGKKAFLALGYGSSPASLAPQLKWTVKQTEDAIKSMEKKYATLNPLRKLTMREVIQLGEVRSLWGRPRRLNAYYQLARPEPVKIQYKLIQPTRRTYQMDIIPLGSTMHGCQAFIKQCKRQRADESWEIVLSGNDDGTVDHIDTSDAFVRNIRDKHFNNPPFANIAFSRVKWVQDKYGLKRELPRLESAVRQAFNSMCQSTGADHLRWAMNNIAKEVSSLEEFRDCKMVLSIHDSLVFEVPEEKYKAFIRAAYPVMCRRPDWSTIDFPVDVEFGRRMGDMQEFAL